MQDNKIIKLNQHGIFTQLLKRIIKLFKKKPRIFNDNNTLPDQAIYICNHSGAGGPFSLSLFFPKLFVPWGAHPMTEGYASRWKYLYYVFYQQKLSYGKIKSFIISTLFALISKMLYIGMHVIPTYPDFRVKKTFEISKKHLNVGNSILIFPEDSSDGYHEVLKKYHSGFIYLATDYYKDHQIDLPIYPIYFSQKKNAILIEKPLYIQDYLKSGFRRDQIAESIKNKVNGMKDQLFELLMN